jgi:hypothetical protein
VQDIRRRGVQRIQDPVHPGDPVSDRGVSLDFILSLLLCSLPK